jgi:tol-pal system protein YbgF
MRYAAVAALPLLLAACTSSEDITLLHREITDVQREVQQLSDSTLDREDLARMEQRMEQLTSQTMRSNADLAQRVTELQEQIEAVSANLELSTRRLQEISQELAATRAQFGAGGAVRTIPQETLPDAATDAGGSDAGAAAAAGGAAAMGAASPDELYRTAYEDYMRGNYDLAAQGFAEYLRRFPDTELSDNALYWIGECHAAQNEIDEAQAAFSRVLEEYPTSDKAAAAQLKKGLLYLEQGDNGQGVVHLQYVVYEHPGTKEADLARERLRSLGLTIR